MSVKTARDLRNALFHVTDLDGTAKRARIEGYNVGGKTGTAHKVKPTGGYFEKPLHRLLCRNAPGGGPGLRLPCRH